MYLPTLEKDCHQFVIPLLMEQENYQEDMNKFVMKMEKSNYCLESELDIHLMYNVFSEKRRVSEKYQLLRKTDFFEKAKNFFLFSQSY